VRLLRHGLYKLGWENGLTYEGKTTIVNGIRTRVCCPPRAFSIPSAGCTVLTQHITSRDSNSAGILVPFICRAFLATA
jgi:hypothetical protein